VLACRHSKLYLPTGAANPPAVLEWRGYRFARRDGERVQNDRCAIED
jgi:hypothetical protein